MNQKLSCLADLAAVDRGAVDLLFKRELCAVLDDLIDRPNVTTARKIIITMSLSPEADDSGTLVGVHTAVEVGTKAPVRRTRETAMVCSGTALAWNDLSPDNYQQRTLDQIEKENDND